MGKMIINATLVFAVGLLGPHTARSQGTLTYVSSLEEAAVGFSGVALDFSLAAGFMTGNNAGGYGLDFVQLESPGSEDEVRLWK